MADTDAIRIDFSRSLYDADAIRETIAAWAHVARFEVEEGETEVSVAITGAPAGVAHVEDHFANHVLSSSIARARRAVGSA